MEYIANFRHGETGNGGQLLLSAKNDEEAIEEIRAFVASGYRNETFAGVDLSNGDHYTARNEHGQVKGRRQHG